MEIKIGHSVDIHRIKKTLIPNNIYLGLESITAPFEIIAYSDGDILIHAIAEAIIGALGEKDLGTHFPDKDIKNTDISGLKILEYTNSLLEKKSYKVINIDATIILDDFQLNPYLDIFRKNISLVLKNTTTEMINIKATTSENTKLNSITAHAVVLIKKV